MEKNVISSLSITYNISMNIYAIIYGIDDYIEMGLNNRKTRKYKLYYNGKGCYFNYGNNRYYLNEFLRVQ